MAVAALTTKGPRGRAHQLSGPDVLTPADELRILGETLGRRLRLVEPPIEATRAGMLAAGMAEAIVARSLADEPPAEILPTAAALLGRPPATFISWAKKHVEVFQEQA